VTRPASIAAPVRRPTAGAGVRTSSSVQIDLDVHDPAARGYLSRVLRRLAECGVTTVRLDAVGYAVKTAGTSCFLTPETFAFIDDLAAEAHGVGLEVLAEVHAPHQQAVDTAAHVDRIYDFALGPLVLHAIFTGDGRPLGTGCPPGPPTP
jgi:sucrose phosphorylase